MDLFELEVLNLIHKSTKDLWELKKDANGEYYIEELFDGPDPLADTI